MTFPPEKHMQGLKNLTIYYKAFWVWTGPLKVREWNLRHTKVSIMCAGLCYRMAAKKARML